MMKKYVAKALMFCGLLVCFSLANAQTAKADNKEDIPLQRYEDLDNIPYPSLTFVTLYSHKVRSYTAINLNDPGQVKMVTKTGLEVTGQGSAWISRDHNGLDIVGTVRDIAAFDNTISWFLDDGQYYINYQWNQGVSNIGIAFLYEEGISDETQSISTLTNTNKIDLDKTYRGYLTVNTPNDYYEFTVKEKSLLTIEYFFDANDNQSSDLGMCTLYDKNKLVIAEGEYKATETGRKTITHHVEAGVYYIKMNGLYGNTALAVKPMYYHIDLTSENATEWTKKPIDINIDTTIDYSEIRVLREDVKESLIGRKYHWLAENPNYVIVNGETFEATKNGIYSVRITDQLGNHHMEKIEVKNIDATKPKVTGVKDKTSYKKAVTIKFEDPLSGINASKTTLNGKAVKSGTKISEQGEYTLKVTDMMGNVRTVVFYVDYDAPTSGIVNNKTYTSAVTLRFKDNASGIKKITINDEEVDPKITTRRYFLDGEYEVKMWDNAGNYRKEVFTIK